MARGKKAPKTEPEPDGMRPGAYFKRDESVEWCLDMHRSASQAFARYCQVHGIELPKAGNCLHVKGDDIAKVDEVLGGSKKMDFPGLRAWDKTDAYAKWQAEEVKRIAKEEEADARKKAGV